MKKLKLTQDKNAVAIRLIRDCQQAVGTIAATIKDGSAIDEELATNCLKVAEFNLADLCKALGIETFTAKERDERFAALRTANMRIRALEAQLGNAQAPEMTQAALKNMADQLNGWWDLEGFGHISDIAFGQYCCKVDFSCNLFGNFRMVDSDTPVTDKTRKEQWHDSLRERGFVLTEEDREVSVVDCDQSRKVLADLIKARMPSATIFKFDNVHKNRSTEFLLRGVEVVIHKIDEILTLPVPKKKTE